PVVGFKRFYVNIGYWPLLFHTVRIEDVSLDGLVAEVDRHADGSFALPELRPTPPEAAPPAPPPAEPSRPWSVVGGTAALREGTLTLHDHITEPPTSITLGLPSFDLKGFSLEYGPEARPSHGVVEARFGDGRARVKTTVATRRDGFALVARLD